MTIAIIITVCALLLLAYVFDLTSSRTRIPSVILLLFLGWLMRQISVGLDISVPDLTELLPVFGTIGLILIVFEGTLELELNKSKGPLIRRSFLASIFPMLIMAFLLAFLFKFFGGASLKDSLTNAIPFCVISSAIAIPTVKSLTRDTKEFVIYESSLSDIIGVLFFNFMALNEHIDGWAFGEFFLHLLLITAISLVATLGLVLLLKKIDHHIKFAPIILLIILVYAVCKIYHLPGLIFILLFGLFLGNLNGLKRFKWMKRLNPDSLSHEVHKLKELTIEGTFLVRAFFFLLFGFLIKNSELLNTSTILWALVITAIIFGLRAAQLKLMKMPLTPVVFIAPRGLITVLLFLSIAPSQSIPFVNRSLVIQVVILTVLVMMVGMILSRKPKAAEAEPTDSDTREEEKPLQQEESDAPGEATPVT